MKKTNAKAPKVLVANDTRTQNGKLKLLGGSGSDDWNNILANQTLHTLWLKHSDDETIERQLAAPTAGLIGISPKDELEAIKDEELRFRRFVELNIIEQVYNLSKTSIVQNAWGKNQHLTIHGWVYDVGTGIIQDLKVNTDSTDNLPSMYRLESATV